MKRLGCCLCALLFFSGCVKAQKKERTRIVHINSQGQDQLIIPSKELSARSEQSEQCAFILSSMKKSIKVSSKEQVEQVEARLIDVPIPVFVEPVSVSYGDRGTKLISYISTLSSKEIKKFYIQEMERFGWRQEYYFEGEEILLSFKKPDRFCSVSVRPTRKIWDKSKNVFLKIFVS